MPITIFTGLPGSGKSARLARAILNLLERNRKWYEKTKILRPVVSNLHLKKPYEKKFGNFLRYWEDVEELPLLQDCDVVIDEIANYFDATQWATLSPDIKRWLQQHRKVGVEIYANTQTFSTVDVSFRRLTDEMYLLRKLMSSPDPSPTKPPIKHIWGISVIRKVDPRTYNEQDLENRAYGFSLMWLNRKFTEDFYDTRQKILPGKFPPLKHVEQVCPDCGFVKTIHR